jgi:hypothetical protein
MFNGPILDVAFGVVSAFLAVSLAAGTLLEAFASITKWRSKTLLKGIKTLVNDPNCQALALDLYNHAAISPRDSGAAKTEKDLKLKPAYIDPQQFAGAFLDLLGLSGVAPAENSAAMVTAINSKVPADAKVAGTATSYPGNAQLNQLLTGIVNRAQGDLDKVRDEVANWFDNGMDRLSGDYKRWSQLLTFLLALLISVVFNIDSISIASGLWAQPALAKTLKIDASTTPDQALTEVTSTLPVGWTPKALQSWAGCTRTSPKACEPNTTARWWNIAGWLITGLAALFGAPFWFDTLQKVVRLKGSGPSPAEKKSGDSASA